MAFDYIEFSDPPITFNLASGRILDGSRNLPAAKAILPVFVCPSDPHNRGRVGNSEFAATNYAACVGSCALEYGSLNEADGVFFSGSHIGFRDLLDGSSHTVAFSERLTGTGRALSSDSRPSAQAAMWEIGSVTTPSLEHCGRRDNGSWYALRGEKWIALPMGLKREWCRA